MYGTVLWSWGHWIERAVNAFARCRKCKGPRGGELGILAIASRDDLSPQISARRSEPVPVPALPDGPSKQTYGLMGGLAHLGGDVLAFSNVVHAKKRAGGNVTESAHARSCF